MRLDVLTDHAAIRAVVDRFLAGDPVRNTMLGTINTTLTRSAWAATDGVRLAVRSEARFPLVLAGDWPIEVRTQLRDLLDALPDLAALSGPEAQVVPLLDVVGPDPRLERQRLFRIDHLLEPTVVGRSSVAGKEHRAFVRACVHAFFVEAHEANTDTDPIADRSLDDGLIHTWLDPSGEPVGMACRRPVLAGSARIGPVYTPPEHRGHGYASGVTADVTRSILAEGGVPVLFTDLANPTSNKIYQALGYSPVEDRIVASRSSHAA